MSQVTKDVSKSKFNTGDIPTQQDFVDLHDSTRWHGEDIAPEDIAEDTTHRFVTDAEKTEWSGKQPAGTYATTSELSSGLVAVADDIRGGVVAAGDTLGKVYALLQAALPEVATSYATISASSAKRLVYVTSDENNNGDTSLYIHTGSTLKFLQTIA